MNFPIRSNFNEIYHKKRGNEYLKGFHTSRNLQWSLSGASIPYSLAHVKGEGWLVGDESGNIWCRNPETGPTVYEDFEGIVELQSGVSEVAPLDRSRILVGEMRGRVTKIDLNNLCEETVVQVNGIRHRAPIKCIKWQPDQSDIFATAGQDGSVFFADLRCPDSLIHSLLNPHQFTNPTGKSRSTMTGLVFNPMRSELFYTTGTPDTCVRLWDMRKLSSSTSTAAKTTRSARTNNRKSSAALLEEFSTIKSANPSSTRKHRSSVALTIDSIGSRLFLSTSNDNIFEFLTNNSELGPVASYTAPGFASCSFFSNISIDPSDRFLLSGSSNGQAFIWDTLNNSSSAFELPVFAQLEVSKTAWAGDKNGSLDAQIACISDDSTFSLFNWQYPNEEAVGIKRARELYAPCPFKEIIHNEDDPNLEIVNEITVSNIPSIPSTPVRKRPTTTTLNAPSPNSANKSILDFFPRSPRVLGQ